MIWPQALLETMTPEEALAEVRFRRLLRLAVLRLDAALEEITRRLEHLGRREEALLAERRRAVLWFLVVDVDDEPSLEEIGLRYGVSRWPITADKGWLKERLTRTVRQLATKSSRSQPGL